RTCVTKQGPTLRTVTGTLTPSLNTRVIPTLVANNPTDMRLHPVFVGLVARRTRIRPGFRFVLGRGQPPAEEGFGCGRTARVNEKGPASCADPLDSSLDSHEHTGGNDKPVQSLDRTSVGLEDVDDPFVRADFELLAALLVNER